MAYMVLARKWRPSTFDDVVGQEHVSRTLKRALELNRWSHAYLFSGPRGVGKTTIARLLAKALNCDEGPSPEPCSACPSCQDITASRGIDVLEIDGASHRGIDEIRTLRENVRYAPTKGKHKVYIIDEVHMLTTEAFNALLKTLEEPPPNVVFVFATTEPHKVPATIASRCQRFEFRKIPSTLIRERLARIAEAEGFDITEEALGLIARRADGSMRDAEGLLDQAVAFAEAAVGPHDLEELLGDAGEEAALALLEAMRAHDARQVLVLLDRLLQRGTDPGQLAQSFGDHLRDLLLAKLNAQTDSLGTMAADHLDRLRAAASQIEEEDLVAMLALWAPLQRELRTSPHPRLSLEMAALRLTKRQRAATVREVLERLDHAEKILLHEAKPPSDDSAHDASGLRSPPTESQQMRPPRVEEPPQEEPGQDEPTQERVSTEEPPQEGVSAEEPLQEGAAQEELSQEEGEWSVTGWPSLVKELGEGDTHLGAWLIGTQLEEVAPGHYCVLFPERHQYHLGQVQAEHLPTLREALTQKLGTEVEVSGRVQEGLIADDPEEAPPEQLEDVPDPAVKKVIDVFNGDLLGYRKSSGGESNEPQRHG
jgi:DNA polymerase-3 subunit gamma/tau